MSVRVRAGCIVELIRSDTCWKALRVFSTACCCNLGPLFACNLDSTVIATPRLCRPMPDQWTLLSKLFESPISLTPVCLLLGDASLKWTAPCWTAAMLCSVFKFVWPFGDQPLPTLQCSSADLLTVGHDSPSAAVHNTDPLCWRLAVTYLGGPCCIVQATDHIN